MLEQFTSSHGSVFSVIIRAPRECPTSHGTAASSIHYLAFFGGSAMPAQHTRSTRLLCGWLVILELSTSTRQLERFGSWQGQLQTSAEDSFIYTVLKHLAYYRCFRTIRSTNWLTYLLIAMRLNNIRYLCWRERQTENDHAGRDSHGHRRRTIAFFSEWVTDGDVSFDSETEDQSRRCVLPGHVQHSMHFAKHRVACRLAWPRVFQLLAKIQKNIKEKLQQRSRLRIKLFAGQKTIINL